MRLERRVIVDADRDAVWKRVSDPACYPEFMANIERWETITDGPVAVGSRFTVHWKVGSVPVGGTVEIVEFDHDRDLAFNGITGVTVRGRFRLRDADDGRTKVVFRLAYEAPGGLVES
jgi:uncharacterized membrane protein